MWLVSWPNAFTNFTQLSTAHISLKTKHSSRNHPLNVWWSNKDYNKAWFNMKYISPSTKGSSYAKTPEHLPRTLDIFEPLHTPKSQLFVIKSPWHIHLYEDIQKLYLGNNGSCNLELCYHPPFIEYVYECRYVDVYCKLCGYLREP